MKKLEVSCPTCKKKFNYYSSDFRPFCCEKCRLIDLGQWLNGTYAVAAQNLNEDEQLTIEQLIDEKKPEEDNHQD
jgi:endogenous inhibitor of DNA gyrase (YacG/DUF329 family)